MLQAYKTRKAALKKRSQIENDVFLNKKCRSHNLPGCKDIKAETYATAKPNTHSPVPIDHNRDVEYLVAYSDIDSDRDVEYLVAYSGIDTDRKVEYIVGYSDIAPDRYPCATARLSALHTATALR